MIYFQNWERLGQNAVYMLPTWPKCRPSGMTPGLITVLNARVVRS